MKAFVELLILCISLFSWVWNSSFVFPNWILFTMFMRSASNLSRSSCRGRHFRDLNQYLFKLREVYFSLKSIWWLSKHESQSHRKSHVLLISSTFRYTTLCERIEHHISRIDYNHDLYICMFSQLINIHSSKFIHIYVCINWLLVML